ncbi:MAG: hypothetical protein J6E41_07855 [Lachnospiraceae bacterium]|nr:hypothetical protein [Lachnospiraceae bacterium]
MANKFEEQRRELVAQMTELLPLIETERSAYIKAEAGRLAAIIGTGYWDKEIEDFEIFHGRKGDDLALIEARKKDPYDITIEEMDWITGLYKKIERVGTETYTNFFNMMPEDKKRIGLLSRMWHKLTHDTLCTEAEIAALKEGHDAFINRKLTDPVKVINNIL